MVFTINSMKYFYLFILFSVGQIHAQEKYVTYHENGKVKIDAFVRNNVLDSLYREYYENGNLKIEGFYKDCDYKTNKREIYIAGCGLGYQINDTINKGKLHGVWKYYLEDGTLDQSKSYYCNLQHGNFIGYLEGKPLDVEFYHEGNIIYSQQYNDQGFVIQTSNYEYIEDEKGRYTKIHSFEFYDDGNFKSETIESNEDNILIYKEYYPNGFLKLEYTTKNDERDGVYREHYENGHAKYEGIYKEDIPIEKQYYFNEDGSLLKIEVWEKGKISKTEFPEK